MSESEPKRLAKHQRSPSLRYCEIAKTDHSANLHANLANLYFKLENYARVILHLRKAIWLDPENREYADNLAYALELASISNQNEFQFVKR